MTQMRLVLAFLLITLLFLSVSLPSSGAHDHDHHETHALSTTTPLKRGLISHLNMKESNSSSGLFQPKKKLRFYMMRKRASSGGIANRARGKSSADVSIHHQISSFHVASVFACSVLLAGFFKV